jgi:N-acetylmuramoyl-L-alanine amidase
MRSFGNGLTAACMLLTLAGSVCAQTAEPAVDAVPESQPAPASPVALRYQAIHEQDLIVINSPASAAADFRLVIERYWSFVRRNATSGYSDNALWQAANLSAESYRRFNEDRDRTRTVLLLQWLRDQYPHSSLRAFALSRLSELDALPAVAAVATTTPDPEAAAEPAATPVDTSGVAGAAMTVIRSIQREVLAEVVRVTLELDREVPFYQERIDGPSRLFFDLKSTRTVPKLVDATFRYDSDIVRHIRLGRQPNSTTRIVLDFENVSSYSVFTLYNPYRIVIDAERKTEQKQPPVAATRTRSARSVQPPILPTLRSAPVTRTAWMRPLPSIASTTPARVIPVPPRSVVVRTGPARPVATALLVTPSTPYGTVASAPAPVLAYAPIPPLPPAGPAAPAAPRRNSSGKFSVARQLGLGVSRIVIDPGHGGHDPGASANDISEAELVLDIALRLETLLSQQAEMDVVLTRRTNEYVALDERTEIANRESADLFLSIHANASANPAARGIETYFLNFALDPQAEAVAARENAASGKTMNSLPSIVKAITLNNKLNESRDFAGSIQRAMVSGLRPGNKTLRDLGVKQAPFVVLIGASMPSVLAEISFVTNRQEGRLLKTPAYRQKIAESLLKGILRYQASLEKVETAALQ